MPVVGDVIDAVDLASDAVEAGTNVYSTYTKTNPDTGEVYTGRTSGTGTPAENVANRDRGHRGKEGFGPAVIDVSSTNKDAIRGREEQKIEQHGKAQKRGGTSGNKIGGISPKNPKRQAYLEAAREIFGELLKK